MQFSVNKTPEGNTFLNWVHCSPFLFCPHQGRGQVMAEEQSLSLSTFPYFHIPALCHHWEREILKGNLWTTCLTSNSPHKRVSMIKLVNPKGNQPSIFIGRTDAEAPILWPPDAKNWLIVKDPDAGEDWKQEEKGTTEDEMVGWHHLLHACECEQAPGDGEGQESLACCSPWGCKESDRTEGLKNNSNKT